MMCDVDISEKRKPQDGKIKCKQREPSNIAARSPMPSAGEVEDMVMRILAVCEPIPIDQLGLTSHNKARLGKTVCKSYGLFHF